MSALLEKKASPLRLRLPCQQLTAQRARTKASRVRLVRIKGTSDRVQSYVRPTSDGLFTFETSAGETLKGTESEISRKYLMFDLDLRNKGYVRMQTFNGSGGQSFNLP